ncbi:MAG: alpha/beta hydrolase [Pseudomonadota bacterium]
MMILFIHGVPDTSFMWTPLIAALGLKDSDYIAPTMPGFDGSAHGAFPATQAAYVDWATDLVTETVAAHGPLHIVGHDWGAPISAQAALNRPEAIKTWTVINAAPEPSFDWHKMARIWQTPLLGELAMAFGGPKAFEKELVSVGMPRDIAAHEVQQIDGHMKRAVLRLYRSAKDTSQWSMDFSPIAPRGLILWGDDDPYVPTKYARRFSERWGLPLKIEEGVGHWGLCERPDAFAAHLKAHWSN